VVRAVYLGLAAALVFVGHLTPVIAQDARLDPSSAETYEASIVAMSEGREPAFALELILSLGNLAASVPPELKGPEAMSLFKADPAEFYRRLKPFHGMSADEIIAAADAVIAR
jgi:hypothetical protein